MTTKPSKVLIIGSGPIIIGQAAEVIANGGQIYTAQPLPDYRTEPPQ